MNVKYRNLSLATLLIVAATAAHAADPKETPATRSPNGAEIEAKVSAVTLAQARQEILDMADQAIMDLSKENDVAAELLGKSYGYAVFDSTKAGLIVTGAGGTGVAVRADTGEHTFMQMGAGGIGIGGGIESYKLILMFHTEATYNDFVNGRWDASLAAQAAVGDQGVASEARFVNDIAVFRMTGGGLFVQFDLTGTKFWPNEELNSET